MEPKAFRVLSYLLTHRDRLISKEELLDHCWAGEFVTESALARCLKVIRQAVDDDGIRQHVIKTQRGYGYRFVAPVMCHDSSPEPVETSSSGDLQLVSETTATEDLNCPQCRHPNHPTRQFCSDCGRALWDSCPDCSFRNAPQDLFCGGCARSLQSPGFTSSGVASPAFLVATPRPETSPSLEERKRVTVMVATLQGLGALADIEEADDLVTQTIRQLVTEVYRVEGFVPQIAGHGFIALFGAPTACEDHVLRALHAAFGLRRALTQMGRQPPHQDLSITLHVVLHTGLVTVGNIDSDSQMQALTQGTTCQFAMQLHQLTAAETLDQAIIVSDAVRQQAAGCFEFLDHAPLSLPLAPQPISVSTCIGALSASSRLEASLTRQHTAFYGRGDEMVMLHRLWERAINAEGQVVCLVGEAGIGKSRLAYEYRQTLCNARLLTMQALSYGTAMPYHAWRPLLRTLLGIDPHDTPEQQRHQMDLSLAALLELFLNSINSGSIAQHRYQSNHPQNPLCDCGTVVPGC